MWCYLLGYLLADIDTSLGPLKLCFLKQEISPSILDKTNSYVLTLRSSPWFTDLKPWIPQQRFLFLLYSTSSQFGLKTSKKIQSIVFFCLLTEDRNTWFFNVGGGNKAQSRPGWRWLSLGCFLPPCELRIPKTRCQATAHYNGFLLTANGQRGWGGIETEETLDGERAGRCHLYSKMLLNPEEGL